MKIKTAAINAALSSYLGESVPEIVARIYREYGLVVSQATIYLHLRAKFGPSADGSPKRRDAGKPKKTVKGILIDAVIRNHPDFNVKQIIDIVQKESNVSVSNHYVYYRLARWHKRKRSEKVYFGLQNMTSEETAILSDESNIEIILRSSSIQAKKYGVDVDCAESQSLLRAIDSIREFIANGRKGDVKSFLVQGVHKSVKNLKRSDRIGGQSSSMRSRIDLVDSDLSYRTMTPDDEAIFNEELRNHPDRSLIE